MRTLKFSVALQLLVVFVSGVLVGGLGYRFYAMRKEPAQLGQQTPPARAGRSGGGPSFRQRYVQEMRERLSLREEQVRKLNDILETTGRRFTEAKKRSDVEVRSLQENQQTQIRAMLDPPQAAEFDRMLKEREEQMKKDRERGRRPRP